MASIEVAFPREIKNRAVSFFAVQKSWLTGNSWPLPEANIIYGRAARHPEAGTAGILSREVRGSIVRPTYTRRTHPSVLRGGERCKPRRVDSILVGSTRSPRATRRVSI